jgi:DNA-binding SARP family transcriptional activator
MSELRIHLLGRFEVLRDGVPIPPQSWRRRRPADLLKLIALSADHRLSRERVIDTLWPDKEPGAGANNLHRALYDLRLVLGDRSVDIAGAYVVLDSNAWVDVDAFEQAVTCGDAEKRREAVALYRGDLAPEDPESPWLQGRRRLLRSRFSEVAGGVAHDAVARGETAEAVTILRRLLVADPAAEDGHRLLMEVYAGAGNRADALRQYDDAVRAVRAAGRGLQAGPLLALRDAIQRREVGPAVTPPPLDGARRAALRLMGTTALPALRGRSIQLESAAAMLAKGPGVFVLLGEPGVGKTHFALELARRAQDRGAVVLAGEARAWWPAAPYGPFASAFGAAARDDARAPPDPFDVDDASPTLSPEAERHRLFGAVADAILATGRGKPVLLVLDELHAADASSLDLLHYLALRATSLLLTVVATCRESAVRAGTPIQAALSHLDADLLARGLRIPRLALAPSVELLGDLLAVPPPPEIATRFCQVTDGNPFQLAQVSRAWDEAGRGEVPRDPPTALRTRLARLDGATSLLMTAAAMAGEPVGLQLAAHAAGLGHDEARAALAAAVQAGLLRAEGPLLRIAHSIVRDELVGSVDPTRRAALHRAIAEALEEEGSWPGRPDAAPDRLAWHWREAFEPRQAFRHLVAAGHRAAVRGGLREALAFHEAALGLLGRHSLASGAERFELLDSVARAHLGLGEVEGAVDAFRSSASGYEAEGWHPAREQVSRARRYAALALATSGDLGAAAREVELGLLDPVGSTSGGGEEAAGLHLLRARLDWHSGRFDAAVASAERCALEAERLGQPELLARSQDLVALALAAAGRIGASPVGRGGPVDRRHGDPAADPAIDLPLVLWDGSALGDLPTAELLRLAALELQRCQERGDSAGAAVPLFALGATHLAAGDLAAAEPPLRQACALFRSSGSALGEALALHRLGWLQRVAGRLHEAMELLAEGLVVAERAPLRQHVTLRLQVARARTRLAAGSLQVAEVIARDAADCAVRHGVCTSCETALRPLQVRLSLARDRLEDADAEARILERLAAARGGRALIATARRTRARVLAAAGRKEDARALLGEARAALGALGRRQDELAL